MVYGYCTDQVDGTSFIGGVFAQSATSYPYSEGLAIGGTSGNLLWKAKRVLTTDDLYTLPTAGSTLGGVKTTSTVTSTSGLTACPIISGVVYYKDTNTTYSAGTGIDITSGVIKNKGVLGAWVDGGKFVFSYHDGNVEHRVNSLMPHENSIGDNSLLDGVIQCTFTEPTSTGYPGQFNLWIKRLNNGSLQNLIRIYNTDFNGTLKFDWNGDGTGYAGTATFLHDKNFTSYVTPAKIGAATTAVATTSANGLMSSTDKTKLNYTNVAYGTCSTAAATAAKVVTVSNNTNWALTAGSIITVLFSNTNTANNPTLNVNGTGAKAIKYCGSTVTTSNLNYGGYKNRPQVFMYDGTSYHFVSWGYESGNTNTLLRTYLDESGTYPVLASRTAASDWDSTYESVYGTIATNITMTPSTGTISAKKIERDGLELARIFGSLIPYGTAIAPSESSPVALNTVNYLKVGNYYCASNANATYITDLPKAKTAFMMQVLSPLSTGIDNETGTWVYRLRIIRFYTGEEYCQYCYSNGTAGNWIYGDWIRTVTENATTGIVSATKFSGSGASLTSLNASNISSGKLGLTYGGTGQNLSGIPAGAIVRNSTDGTGLWYTASSAGAFYCEGTNTASKFGTLPIAYGGTGATSAANALTNLGLTATAAELNYCDGVTSNIQTQLNGKASSSHTHTGTWTTSNLTFSLSGTTLTITTS